MNSKRDSNSLEDSKNVSSLVKKIKLEHKLISEKFARITQTLMYMNMKSINFC